MEIGGEGARKKDTSFKYAELLLGYSIDARLVVEVFSGYVTFG